MANPDGADDVAFYDFSAWPTLGGDPGRGNTVITGRIDHNEPCKGGTIPPPCQAVFWDLRFLAPGDAIQIFWNQQEFQYTVGPSCIIEASARDFEKVVATTKDETLTLITGAGDFRPW